MAKIGIVGLGYVGAASAYSIVTQNFIFSSSKTSRKNA